MQRCKPTKSYVRTTLWLEANAMITEGCQPSHEQWLPLQQLLWSRQHYGRVGERRAIGEILRGTIHFTNVGRQHRQLSASLGVYFGVS
jgi:hypothetical protein